MVAIKAYPAFKLFERAKRKTFDGLGDEEVFISKRTKGHESVEQTYKKFCLEYNQGKTMTWKELQAKGYLVKEIVRDEQGRFSKVIWHLYQTPVEVVAPEVKEVAQEDQKVKETETKVSQEIKEIAEQELEAVFTTLDAMDHLEEEEKETIREEIVDEFGQTLDKTWVQENFREAWEETLDNLKCREYFVSYLINHMKNKLSLKRLKEARASKEIASPTLDFYIPMDGPWNGHD